MNFNDTAYECPQVTCRDDTIGSGFDLLTDSTSCAISRAGLIEIVGQNSFFVDTSSAALGCNGSGTFEFPDLGEYLNMLSHVCYL